MEEKNPDIEKIENYLNNKLSPEEKEAFEKRVKEDPDFRREVILYQRLIDKIRSEGEREFRNELNEIHEANFQGKSRQLLPKYSIAATIVFLLVFAGLIYFFLFSPDGRIPGNKEIVFQKEVVADDGSLGFVEGDERIEKITIRIEETEDRSMYMFSDTLKLKLRETYAPDEIAVKYLSGENAFLLTVPGESYKFYRGFEYFLPLEPQ